MVKRSLLLETRGNASVLLCHKCNLPFFRIENGVMSVESKHGSAKHTNTLTIAHLKMLLIEMVRQLTPEPEQW
jgi:hypothetical protein